MMLRAAYLMGVVLGGSLWGIGDLEGQQPREQQPSVLVAVRSIPLGRAIRARRHDGSLIPGPFGGVVDGTLVIADLRVGSHEVDSLWVAVRAAKRGAKTGALAGGITGAVGVGAFSALIVTALCETNDCPAGEAAVVGALAGGVLGAGAGALLGALIGSGVRGWKLVYVAPKDAIPRPDPPALVVRPTPDRIPLIPPAQIDSLRAPSQSDSVSLTRAASAPIRERDRHAIMRVAATWGRGLETSAYGGAMGVRLAYLPRFGRNIWAGIEISSQGIGSWKSEQLGVRDGGFTVPVEYFVYITDLSISVLQFAAAARAGKSLGRVRPYLTASLGANIPGVDVRSYTECPSCTTSNEFDQPLFDGKVRAGLSLGGGVDLMSNSSSRSIGIEARGHLSPAFFTIGVTVGTGW